MKIQKRIIPPAVLQKFVDSIWISEKAACDTSIKAIPGTGSEMYVAINGGWSLAGHMQEPIMFSCMRNYAQDVTILEGTVIMAVRFRFNAIRHFCNVPINEFLDELIPAYKIFGDAIIPLEQRLGSHMEQNVIVILSFLMNQLHINYKPEYFNQALIRQIYTDPQEKSISELADDCNLSIRQFEKRFMAEMYVTAKQFQSLSRFNQVVKSCILSRTKNYLPIVLDWGYYDQAHFIKEFRNKAQITPLEFFTENAFSTHFYNTGKADDYTFVKLKY
ncbi:MAG TPA: AraC family transcriptional regulator [Bacteroidales bacterium]|nr:AraC family transcriptional regulator [Bacteroidales bacterium]